MNAEARRGNIEDKVQYLLDRVEILDCIAQHARGHDRHDVELLTDAYHEDGVDEHGYAINSAADYAQWANAAHAAGSRSHTHNITTHTCDIDGDVAHCESYVLVCLLNNDGKTARIISGRYVDKLERRHGAWKIALRRTTVDVILAGDASILQAPVFREQGYSMGMRDKRDISYQRPLSVSESPARW